MSEKYAGGNRFHAYGKASVTDEEQEDSGNRQETQAADTAEIKAADSRYLIGSTKQTVDASRRRYKTKADADPIRKQQQTQQQTFGVNRSRDMTQASADKTSRS